MTAPSTTTLPAESDSAALSARVTTVVVAYNGRDVIGDCLAALLQSDDASSILVFDNASVDGTVELVRREFPGVQVIASDVNLGYGEACNRAARFSTSEYLAVINQDAIARPGWTAALAQVLDGDSTIGIATAKVLIKGAPDLVNACGNVPHYTGITTCRGFGRPSLQFDTVEDVPAISGAAFLIRRSLLLDLGGFDGDFFLYFEDTDLSLRLQLAGYRCVHVPTATVLHDFEPRFSAAKLQLLERNRAVSWLKIFDWRTLAILSPALLLTEVLVLAYSVRRGPRCLAAKLRASGSVLRDWQVVLERRRAVQATRRRRDSDLIAVCAPQLELGELGAGDDQTAVRAVNAFFRAWNRVARAAIHW